MAGTVLVVDDQPSILDSMGTFFRLRGWDVHIAETAAAGLSKVQRLEPDLLVLDLRLPDRTGLEVLQELSEFGLKTRTIIITAHQDMESTIQAIKLGAFDYIHKPVDIDEMDTAVRRLEEAQAAQALPREGERPEPRAPRFLVGKSSAMKEVFKTIAPVSESRVTVLVQGESGTGKELIAHAIHSNSPWRDEVFTAMDCSTFVPTLMESELFGYEKGAFTGADRTHPGRLERTGNGTVFFDEIGELPLPLQSKLLRFIQEGEFVRVGGATPIRSAARIIAATNRDLRAMVAEGTFREDLYFRLQVVTIQVPPLRSRRSDIPALAEHLLGKMTENRSVPARQLSQEALRELAAYDWPGNVRELENVLTRAAVLVTSPVLTGDDIRAALPAGHERPGSSAGTSLATAERECIERALVSCNWHFGRTCEALGLSRPTLRARMRKFGLVPPHRKPGPKGRRHGPS